MLLQDSVRHATADGLDTAEEASVSRHSLFTDAPRWLFLAMLVFAPWAYGATRPWAIQILSGGLIATCVLWIGECLASRRRPRVPILPVIGAAILLIQGWWMTFNAHSQFVELNETFLPRACLAAAPGSVDVQASTSLMFLMTGLLGTFLFCCELFQDSAWRKRVWITLAVTGASIAALGILQKIGGDAVLALMWEPEKRDVRNNFGGF